MGDLKFYRAEKTKEYIEAAPPGKILEPFRIAPHVWHVSGHFDYGDYLIDTGDGLMLIDTPTPEFESACFDAIRKVGFDPKDVKWHFITHWHFDHDGCAASLKALSGCKIFMSAEDWGCKLNVPPMTYLAHQLPVAPYYEPDVLITEPTAQYTFGNFTFDISKAVGHTPGALIFRFDDVDEDGTVYHCAMHGGLGSDTMESKARLISEGIPPEARDIFVDQCLELSRWDVDITLPSHINQCGYSRDYPADRSDFKHFVDKRVWPVMLLERRGFIMELRGRDEGKK